MKKLLLIMTITATLILTGCLNLYNGNKDNIIPITEEDNQNVDTGSKEISAKNEILYEYAKNEFNISKDAINSHIIDFDNDGIKELCVMKGAVDSGTLCVFYSVNDSNNIVELKNQLKGNMNSNGVYKNMIFSISEMYVAQEIGTTYVDNYIVSRWGEGFHAEIITLFEVEKENDTLQLTEIFTASCDSEKESKLEKFINEFGYDEYHEMTGEEYVPHVLEYKINGEKVEYPYELINELKYKYRILDGGYYSLYDSSYSET